MSFKISLTNEVAEVPTMIRSSVSRYVRRTIAQPPPFLPVVRRRLLHPCHGHGRQVREADRGRDVSHAGRVVRGVLRRWPAQVPATMRTGRLSDQDGPLVAVLLADAGQAERTPAAGEPAGWRGRGPEGHHVVVFFHAEAGWREILFLICSMQNWNGEKPRVGVTITSFWENAVWSFAVLCATIS